MFAELSCGRCDCSLQLHDEGNPEAVWLMVYRFADAHVECGFMAPRRSELEPKTRTIHRPQ